MKKQHPAEQPKSEAAAATPAAQSSTEQELQRLAIQAWPGDAPQMGPEGDRRLIMLRAKSPAEVACGNASAERTLAAQDHEPSALARLDHYLLLEELGSGGMGVVYRALDEQLRREVAIKVLRPQQDDPASRARVLREAQAAAQIEHPHVVRVYAVRVGQDAPSYLVMELIDGPTLADRIHACGALGPHEAASIFGQAAQGLAAAHTRGLIHRDVKPGNILLDHSGQAKVTDFGLVRSASSSTRYTRTGTLAGTPEYMSPEQVGDSATIDGRSDVYSLGVSLYEALTGEVPFRGTPPMILRQIVEEDPRPLRQLNESVPRDLETIVLRAMEKSPARRYSGMAALSDDLQRWLEGKPIRARRIGAAGKAARWCRRRPAMASLAATLLLVTIGGFAGILWQWQRAEAQRRIAQQQTGVARQERRRAERILQAMLREQKLAREKEVEAEEQRYQANQARGQLIQTVFEAQLTRDPTQEGIQREFSESLQRMMRTAVVHRARTARNPKQAAAAYAAMGRMQRRQGNAKEALTAYRKAHALFEKMAEAGTQGQRTRQALAMCCRNLGELHTSLGEYPQALVFHKQASDLLESLQQKLPGALNYRLETARSRISEAECHFAANESDRGVQAISDARKTLDSIARDEILNFQFLVSLARDYRRLGEVQLAAGDSPQAAESLQSSTEVWQQYFDRVPYSNAHRSEAAGIYGKLAEIYTELGESDAARGAAEKAAELEKPTERPAASTARAHKPRGRPLQVQRAAAIRYRPRVTLVKPAGRDGSR